MELVPRVELPELARRLKARAGPRRATSKRVGWCLSIGDAHRGDSTNYTEVGASQLLQSLLPAVPLLTVSCARLVAGRE